MDCAQSVTRRVAGCLYQTRAERIGFFWRRTGRCGEAGGQDVLADGGGDPGGGGLEGGAGFGVRTGRGRAGRGRGREDVFPDTGGHPGGGFPYCVARQMGIARGGLDPRVAEQPGDRGQAFAERERAAGEGMANIVYLI